MKIKNDHSIIKSTILFIVLLFSAIPLSAQETEKVKDKKLIANNKFSSNSVQGVGDEINIKNENDSTLIKITDEGDKGSITLPIMTSPPTITTNKLYNENGELKFNGSTLGGGNSPDSLNHLADAIYDGESLFIGESAGILDDHGASDGIKNGNTAVGKLSLSNSSTGNHNSAFGYGSLASNTSGQLNIGVGSYALIYNQQGSRNTAVGFLAGSGETTHSKSGNVFLGYKAGYYEIGNNKLYIQNDSSTLPLIYGDFTDGSEIVEINGNFHVTGNITTDGALVGATEIDELSDAKFDGYNLFIGLNAGINDNGDALHNNTGIGIDALSQNISGANNTALGKDALGNIDNINANVAVGNSALQNADNWGNVGIGYWSLKDNSGRHNVGVGMNSGESVAGNRNTLVGYRAGYSTSVKSVSGSVFIGAESGSNENSSNKLYINNDSSSSPLIYGDFTDGNEVVEINGDFHVTGDITTDGTIPGVNDINDLTDAKTGGNSIFIGSGSGTNDDGTDNRNTSVGINSLSSTTTGNSNIAIGYNSMNINNTGSNNTAIGLGSSYANTVGNSNVAIGYQANHLNEEGDNNTIIGYQAGRGDASHNKSGNILIGYQAGYTETGNNKLYIQTGPTASPLIWGDFANDRIVINGNSTHNSNNRTFFSNGEAGGTSAWFNDSDERLKENIVTINSALEKVKKLRGVNYKWKDKEKYTDGIQMGFIAQEVEKVIPEVVDNSNDHYSMQYAPLTALLIEALKEQQKIIDELKNEKSNLSERLSKIENFLESKYLIKATSN